MARFKDWVAGLTAASALDGTELIPLIQAGVSKKASPAVIDTAVPNALGTANAGTRGKTSDSGHVHAIPSALTDPGYRVFVPGTSDSANTETAVGFNVGASGFGPPDGMSFAIPLFFSRSTPLGMGLNIAVAGAAGSVARIGIYNDNGNGRPGTVAFDYGAPVATATGNVWGTGTFTPVLGVRYWGIVAHQGSATGPQIQGAQGHFELPNVNGGQAYAYRYDGITGALTSLAAVTPTTLSSTVPRFRFRI